MENNSRLIAVVALILALVSICLILGLMMSVPRIARRSVDTSGIGANDVSISLLQYDFNAQQTINSDVEFRVINLEENLGNIKLDELDEEVEELDDTVRIIKRCLLGSYSGFDESEYLECFDKKL